MRLRPSRIAIIDGYFEHTPAVWHKEILYAMSKGVSVFGASSMGALRAAELDRYGMVGIGKIYQAYCDDPTFGDDEVAVSHFDASYGYQSASQSLVDIRMLLNNLVGDEICSQDLAEKIINQVKNMHYTKRDLISACELVEALYAAPNKIAEIRKYVAASSRKSQKQEDAKTLLAHMNGLGSKNAQSLSEEDLAQPIFFRTLQLKVDCSVFPVTADWLPEAERVAQHNAKSSTFDKNMRRCAHLLALVENLEPNVDLSGWSNSPVTDDERQLILAFMRLSGCYINYTNDCFQIEDANLIQEIKGAPSS